MINLLYHDNSINDKTGNVNKLENIFDNDTEIERKQLYGEISKRRFKKPERKAIKQKILESLENGDTIDKKWLEDLGYSNKEIESRFGKVVYIKQFIKAI